MFSVSTPSSIKAIVVLAAGDDLSPHGTTRKYRQDFANEIKRITVSEPRFTCKGLENGTAVLVSIDLCFDMKGALEDCKDPGDR